MPQSISNINVRLYINAFLLSLIVLHTLLLHFVLDISIANSIADAAVTYLSLYQIAFAMHLLLHNRLPKFTQIFIIILVSMAIAIGWIYLYSWLIEYLYDEHAAYLRFWNDSKFVRTVVGWVVLCNLMVLLFLSQSLTDEAAEQERTSYNEQLKKDAELLKLRQQINPHFLFNTLNSVNALIALAPDKAKQMIEQMSVYFRNSLKREENTLITIREELDDLNTYFDIEKLRFGSRLEISKIIDEDCKGYKIPPFLLQPLVENAIKYGLYGTIGACLINIEINTAAIQGQNYLHFTISNNFDKSSVQPKGTGFGLNFIRRRLYLLYARNDLLETSISSANNKSDENIFIFRARLIIPVSYSNNEYKSNNNR